jgi:hypothetical protein
MTQQDDADALLARIHPTADYADLEGCELVVEAVFEKREIKADVTKKTEAVIATDAIFASNTSTLPITGLAEASARPANFIGLHFFSPAEKMPLVEIIVGKDLADATLARSMDYVRAIGKTPIVVNDSRGFYTSRVFGTYVSEGMALLEEGVAAGADRQRRADGRHAGGAAGAGRRGLDRTGAQDREADARRPRRRLRRARRRPCRGADGGRSSAASARRAATASTTIRPMRRSTCGRDSPSISRSRPNSPPLEQSHRAPDPGPVGRNRALPGRESAARAASTPTSAPSSAGATRPSAAARSAGCTRWAGAISSPRWSAWRRNAAAFPRRRKSCATWRQRERNSIRFKS